MKKELIKILEKHQKDINMTDSFKDDVKKAIRYRSPYTYMLKLNEETLNIISDELKDINNVLLGYSIGSLFVISLYVIYRKKVNIIYIID